MLLVCIKQQHSKPYSEASISCFLKYMNPEQLEWKTIQMEKRTIINYIEAEEEHKDCLENFWFKFLCDHEYLDFLPK